MLIQMIADNTQRELLAGGFAQVSFDVPNQSGHLAIPASAMMMGKEGPRVATLDSDNKVVIKKVQVARDNGATIELATGISLSDRILQSPPDGILPGDMVKVAEAAPAPVK
jgi:multidrug efflux pump subunit AcrA (membrane-fusion protein)